MFRTFLMPAMALVAALTFAVGAYAGGEDPTNTMDISTEVYEVSEGAGTLDVTMDLIDDIRGWSMGMCVTDAQDVVINAGITPSATVETIDDGDPPFFEALNWDEDGFTVGLLISTSASVTLGAGAHDLYTLEFDFDVSPSDSLPAVVPVDFCDSLGNPLVDTFFAKASGPELGTQLGGGITVDEDAPSFEFAMRVFDDGSEFYVDDESYEYRPTEVPQTFCVIFTVEQIADGDLIGSQGFQLGIEHDSDEVENIDDGAEAVGPLGALDDGDGPAFFGVSYNEGGTGITIGCIYSFTDTDLVIEFDGVTDMVKIAYTTVGTFLDGDVDGDSTRIEFSDSLGVPAIENAVQRADSEFTVAFDNLEVDFIPILVEPYIRGDCNDDGGTDIADGIHLLNAIFRDSDIDQACFEACDANNDGLRDTSDAIYMFNYQFQPIVDVTSPPPPAPFPDCGVADEDGEQCEEGNDTCAD